MGEDNQAAGDRCSLDIEKGMPWSEAGAPMTAIILVSNDHIYLCALGALFIRHDDTMG